MLIGSLERLSPQRTVCSVNSLTVGTFEPRRWRAAMKNDFFNSRECHAAIVRQFGSPSLHLVWFPRGVGVLVSGSWTSHHSFWITLSGPHTSKHKQWGGLIRIPCYCSAGFGIWIFITVLSHKSKAPPPSLSHKVGDGNLFTNSASWIQRNKFQNYWLLMPYS